MPDDADKIENLKWLREALESIRYKEDTLTIEGTSAPDAYVFVTNYPCHYNLDATHYGWAVVAEGSKYLISRWIQNILISEMPCGHAKSMLTWSSL